VAPWHDALPYFMSDCKDAAMPFLGLQSEFFVPYECAPQVQQCAAMRNSAQQCAAVRSSAQQCAAVRSSAQQCAVRAP
jgi:hypothetical protein